MNVMTRFTKAKGQNHRPNGLIGELRSKAPAQDKKSIQKANKEAKKALAEAKKSAPSILATAFSTAKIQKLLAR